jgi:hypothetical protein
VTIKRTFVSHDEPFPPEVHDLAPARVWAELQMLVVLLARHPEATELKLTWCAMRQLYVDPKTGLGLVSSVALDPETLAPADGLGVSYWQLFAEGVVISDAA